MSKRVIISGGGTGGHIYPALAIANSLKEIDSTIEILFVGAEGKMEMEKVPSAGYEIIGLPVRGLKRKISFSTINTVYRLIKSIYKSYKILKKFKPDIAVGVGGYASGPLCFVSSKLKIPIVLQEQNSYPGITNKLLAPRAKKIFVAYDGMNRFFDAKKLMLTGNPVRQDIVNTHALKKEAYEYYGVDSDKKTIVIVGGSLGARTINESILSSLGVIRNLEGIQILWQTGSFYEEEMDERMENNSISHLHKYTFFDRMDYIYSIADLIISRSGACTISELCITGKPVILVPSPNVAEDHQTKNAMALSNCNAAVLVEDKNAKENLINTAVMIINDEDRLNELSKNINKLSLLNSADIIAREILNLCNK